MDFKSYSLSTILKRVKEIIDEKTSGKHIWIKAEISNINFHQSSGHCYIDLVETKDKILIAQCKAKIWKSALQNIQRELGSDFLNILKKGNEFLCQAEIVFSEVYGFSLQITKVDINFSLGDLEKRKQETIDKLKAEGIFDSNKSKIAPLVIKRIALIASTSTNGYEDFYKQLKNNQYGYIFEVTDFPASVQGENAITEICAQLEKLNHLDFDIVAIIRGGGSKLDLDVFNNYNIAKAIALHNLPVYTGIGHENDFSVSDMVASMFHKTPTALGAHIVEIAHIFEVKVNNTWFSINEIKNQYFELQKSNLKLNIQTLTTKSISITQLRRGSLHQVMTRINAEVINEINLEKNKLTIAIELIKTNPPNFLLSKKQALKNSMELIQINFQSKIRQSIESNNFSFDKISTYALKLCTDKRTFLNNILEVIRIYHPDNILKKGYAIPRYKGDLLSEQSIKPNEELELELNDRIIIVSYIKTKEKWTTLLTKQLPKN